MKSAEMQSRAGAPKAQSATCIWLIFISFSAFYFTEVLIRQSEKYFWYDELCTVLYCRLDLHTLARAGHTGLDFNTLVFYLLTKGSQTFLGAGLLGARAPEIVGFWVLCICLFRFMNRRVGLAAGVIAMMFPLFTETLYYAYEARPYGLILGFCGTALVSWQMLLEGKRTGRWLFAFGASLLCAFMLHSFALLIAVPFGLAEAYREVRRRSICWRFWIALVIPAIIAIPSYIPLTLAYREIIGNSNFASFFPHDWGQIPRFYIALLSPCVLLILFGLIIMVATVLSSRSDLLTSQPRVFAEEVIVAICFSLLPVLGFTLAKAMHATVFARYFSSALVGICLLLAMAFSMPCVRRFGRSAFVGLLVFASLWQIGGVFWNRYTHTTNFLAEPITSFKMNMTLNDPLANYEPLLARIDTSAPIGITNALDFLYLVNYCPKLRQRLYYVTTMTNDASYRMFNNFRPLSPIRYNSSVSLTVFLRSAPHVYIFGGDSTGIIPVLEAGAHLRSLRAANYRFLADAELDRRR